MNRSLAILAAGLPLLGTLSGPSTTHAVMPPEPPLLSVAAGAAGLFDRRQDFFWAVEYRPAFRLFHLGPWLLAGTGRNQEFYAAAGLLADLPLGKRWVLTPSFGGGYYHAEKGLDLGFDMQFRSAIELAWRFRGGQRLGISFAHLSNGSLGDFNPGTETLSIAVALPLDRLLLRKRSAGRPYGNGSPLLPPETCTSASPETPSG